VPDSVEAPVEPVQLPVTEPVPETVIPQEPEAEPTNGRYLDSLCNIKAAYLIRNALRLVFDFFEKLAT
jgi:hypothetical protein